MDKQLELRGVSVRYGNTVAVESADLALEAGQIGCLLGPSGCGKTTLLRAIAGFEPLDAGEITLHGQQISTPSSMLPPEQRRVGMVFQDFALFPHLSVGRNVAFGLKDLSGGARQQRRQEMLELVGLAAYADRFPHELSGGQQQRVALARALAPAPEIVLLDEPFSSLDIQLRESLAREVRDLLKASGVTAILVTHDQKEAFAIADRIALLNSGRIVQQGTPRELYQQPVDEFAARFVGAGQVIDLAPDRHSRLLADLGLPLATARVMVRPEAVTHAPDSEFQLEITGCTFHGAATLFELVMEDGQRLEALVSGHQQAQPGERLPVRFNPGLIVPLPN